MAYLSPDPEGNRDPVTGRFVKGVSGNPGGRPSKRSLRDALRDYTDPDEFAKELLKRAKKSDMLMKYVMDQLDGLPHQSHTVDRRENLNVKLMWSDGTPITPVSQRLLELARQDEAVDAEVREVDAIDGAGDADDAGDSE